MHDFAGQRPHGALGMQNRLTCSRVRYARPVLFLGEFLCAAACAQNHSNLTFLFHRHRCGIEAGILDGFGLTRPRMRYARETCLRSRASTQASSSNSGISPAMCTGREDGSKREIRFTPIFRREERDKKLLCLYRWGLTTPIPVMTTRGTIGFCVRSGEAASLAKLLRVEGPYNRIQL